MFAPADAKEVEGLLDEAIGHFCILGEVSGQPLVTNSKRADLLAKQKPRGQTRLAPSPVILDASSVHRLKTRTQTRLGQR